MNHELLLISASKVSDQEIWAGETFGHQMLTRLLSELRAGAFAICLVDLGGISLVTASAFRAAFRALREHVVSNYGIPTVFVNAVPATIEEAEYVASKFAETYMFGDLADGSLDNLRLVGRLDEPLLSTFSLLQQLGESDARALYEHVGSPGVTAWHNRLTDLAARGLLIARAQGRSRTYRAISKELLHGN